MVTFALVMGSGRRHATNAGSYWRTNTALQLHLQSKLYTISASTSFVPAHILYTSHFGSSWESVLTEWFNDRATSGTHGWHSAGNSGVLEVQCECCL